MTHSVISQSIAKSLEDLEQQKSAVLQQLAEIENKIIDRKQVEIIDNLKKLGLPSDNYIEHLAMILEYCEEHEQARWVAHMIMPYIKNGQVYRTNDFRVDPKIKTGTAVQEDYFLTDTLVSGEVEYDGFGYDRGHLAPSADFRWSEAALSESYFYSNMSPQDEEFNREIWAELESYLRSYVIKHDVPLYVVTIPILEEGLPTITRSINEVSIPKKFAKAVYDPVNKIAIGFVMDNKKLDYSLKHYAVSIDELEKVSGVDVFRNLDEKIEATLIEDKWFDKSKIGDKEPIFAPSLPRNCFNTVQAQNKIGETITVCGHLVATKKIARGMWLNLDRKFPNQTFSVFIEKKDLANFDYDLDSRFKNESICIEGKITKNKQGVTVYLSDQNKIARYVKAPSVNE